jgi:hypothetical protein
VAENVSKFQSLVPDDFNAKPDEFVDSSENTAIDQVDDNLQRKLRETPDIFAGDNLQYSKYTHNFKTSFGHHD